VRDTRRRVSRMGVPLVDGLLPQPVKAGLLLLAGAAGNISAAFGLLLFAILVWMAAGQFSAACAAWPGLAGSGGESVEPAPGKPDHDAPGEGITDEAFNQAVSTANSGPAAKRSSCASGTTQPIARCLCSWSGGGAGTDAGGRYHRPARACSVWREPRCSPSPWFASTARARRSRQPSGRSGGGGGGASLLRSSQEGGVASRSSPILSRLDRGHRFDRSACRIQFPGGRCCARVAADRCRPARAIVGPDRRRKITRWSIWLPASWTRARARSASRQEPALGHADSLRAQIAWCCTDLVFNDTVVNNIGCGDPRMVCTGSSGRQDRPRPQFILKLPQGSKRSREGPCAQPG